MFCAPRTPRTVKNAVLFTALAGTALPAANAHAAYVDNTSWTINVSADPIGCPGTATVTANFRFRKGPAGGPLNGGTLNARLYDADGDLPFGLGDDHIGTTTVTWGNQAANFVDLTITFEVECIQTDDPWCTIRGNAGQDDEGDPHEMYIVIEEPNSGVFSNNTWTSPKDQGGWIKYSFPLRCGCDENAGNPAEYDIFFEPTGQSVTTINFELPPVSPTSPPLEFFETVLLFDTDRLDPQELVVIADGGRATDIFGELQVQPVPGGLLVGAPVLDPEAAQQMQHLGFELIMQQADPMDLGMTRIRHEPQQTVAFFADGSAVGFQPVDGEIPLRPFDTQPPQLDPGLVIIDPLGQPQQILGQPGAVTDNMDPFYLAQQLPGQTELELRVLDLQGQPVFEAVKPVAPDGSFDLDLGQAILPPAGTFEVNATDAAGNSALFAIGFGGCNAADIAPTFGVLDLLDINAFVIGFGSLQPESDLNNDGLWDLTDVSLFISAFTSGCP
jgi:hypothetical protein